MNKITVKNIEINVTGIGDDDYIRTPNVNPRLFNCRDENEP